MLIDILLPHHAMESVALQDKVYCQPRLLREIFDYVRLNKDFPFVITAGSRASGLRLPTLIMYNNQGKRSLRSDTDLMVFHPSLEVKKGILEFESYEEKSVYGKIISRTDLDEITSKSAVDGEARYLNSDKYRKYLIIHRESKHQELLNNSRSGPAIERTNLGVTKGFNEAQKYSADIVISVLSSETLQDVLGKKPELQYMPRELQDRILASPIFYVAKARCDSAEPELEWRQSFSLQELLLITYLNDSQKQVYLTLGYIILYFNTKWKAVHPNLKGFPSYWIKNVLFHVSNTADNWKDNKTGCLLQLIAFLNEALRQRTLPQYLNPSNNLLADIPEEETKLYLSELAKLVTEKDIEELLLEIQKSMRVIQQETEISVHWPTQAIEDLTDIVNILSNISADAAKQSSPVRAVQALWNQAQILHRYFKVYKKGMHI